MNQEKITELEKTICRDYSNTAGIVVLKKGRTEYENYFNGCTSNCRIHVYSVTKSILSILIGIALDRGYIKNIHQKVLDFFPEYTVKNTMDSIRNITLENLLTMTAPYKYKFAPYLKYFTSDDWVKFSLEQLGGKGQIGKFRYAPLIGPDLLSGILAKTSGCSVFTFASEHLFSPLGITVEKNIIFHSKEEQMAFNSATDISGWVSDEAGNNAAGWGLTLSPAVMAKIGQLYLNGGMWEGREIVSKSWIDESTKEHSRWKKQDLPYGYLWWLCDENANTFAAMGDGGNTIYVNKEKNLVVSIAALFTPKAKDRIGLIKEYIEPVFDTGSL